MKEPNYPRCCARSREIIEVEEIIGDGTEENPKRLVFVYFEKGGEYIVTRDDFFPDQKRAYLKNTE